MGTELMEAVVDRIDGFSSGNRSGGNKNVGGSGGNRSGGNRSDGGSGGNRSGGNRSDGGSGGNRSSRNRRDGDRVAQINDSSYSMNNNPPHIRTVCLLASPRV